LELRDHEYKNFLQNESIIIKKQTISNLIQRNIAGQINASVNDEEEALDESD